VTKAELLAALEGFREDTPILVDLPDDAGTTLAIEGWSIDGWGIHLHALPGDVALPPASGEAQ
jgi:hypothetical protein